MLLLDEPFGALDAKVRKDLRKWLREIHDRTGLTTVFVTHDQAEAMEVADRVADPQRRPDRADRHAATRSASAPATPFVRDVPRLSFDRRLANWRGPFGLVSPDSVTVDESPRTLQ